MADDCLFCRIVAKEIPAEVVRESERTMAFRDINPQAPTHVQVIPRVHYPNALGLAEADQGLLDELVRTAHEVARDEGIDETGYRLVLNTGAGAGQVVFHVHLHLLGGRPMTWPPG